MSANRPGWRLAPALAITAAIIWAGRASWAEWSRRDTMKMAYAGMAEGNFEATALLLARFPSGTKGSDEATYLLGICEQARGRPQAAAEAWSRVAPGSVFSVPAVYARVRLLYDRIELAGAERLVIEAAGDPRNERTELFVLLAPIYRWMGRYDEAERLIEACWEHLRDAGRATPDESSKLVRLHIEQTWKAPSPESLRDYWEEVGRVAPNDDRGWLGRANFAIQTGARDEAKRWLDLCRLRRPDDVAVWRAWLNWSIAADAMNAVSEALKHLPAAESTPTDLHRLNAWICSRRGDFEGERRELDCVIAATPADDAALDRLAQLAEKAGQPARAAELRGKKAEMSQLRARYLKLYDRMQPMRDAEEMAGLAEQLGRNFEARVFLTLAIDDEPEREDLRRDLARLSERRPPAVAERGKTLADVLANELGTSRP
jgi:enediyne biosynthesis protein E4